MMIRSTAERRKLIDKKTLSELDRTDTIRDNIPIISQASERDFDIEDSRDIVPQVVKSSRRHGHHKQDRRAIV